eukprot:CAMPEP_0116077928 /NCGR_PEP_ID=MMETSP0327-20121206/331_1 /TAXON_ID=44447 /ORGANISM="Pseudo-nitzschia delicatissima, Strain B596" /LENGTH=638 /DNA_ID=CAMNT_0003568441 /DNA_START=146 /DNA_END=2062 /DNA_ORIENTATION=-
MEMTDRRSWNQQSSSLSARNRTSSFSSSSSPKSGEGVSEWCNDEILPRNRNLGSVGTNNARVQGIKRFHIILCLVTVLTLGQLMGKGPSMIEPDDMGHVVIKNKTQHETLDKIPTTAPPQEIPTFPDEEPIEESTMNPTATPITPVGDDHNSTGDVEIVNGSKSESNSSDANTTEVDDKSPNDDKNQTETLPPSTTIIEEEAQNTTISTNISSSGENKTVDDLPSEATNETQTDVNTTTIPPSSSPTEGKEEEPPKKPETGIFSNHLTEPLSDSDLSPMARNFAETHCDLTQVKDGAWYPSSPEDNWQQRAPYLIFAGVWNAGIQPLATALLKHPQISSAKTDGFFLPKQFSKYISVQTNDKTVGGNQTSTNTFNVKVFAARERMYAQVYSKAMFQEKSEEFETVDNNSDTTKIQKVAVDVSPGLIFYAHKTAHSILCTAPWVKVVILLRNPIDRLYRQWAYSVQNLNLKLSLEDWMAQEMKLLQSVGLIGAEEPQQQEDETILSEREAWEKYQSVRKVAGAIGRSLYVFQLEEWIQAYVAAGKNPSDEIMILTTEDIEEDPEHEYLELLRFLGLNPFEDNGSVASGLGETLTQASELDPMTPETRTMLKKFFKPYNKRLTDLLTSNGFEGNWDKRWE